MGAGPERLLARRRGAGLNKHAPTMAGIGIVSGMLARQLVAHSLIALHCCLPSARPADVRCAARARGTRLSQNSVAF